MSPCLLGWSVHGGPTNPRIEANVMGLDCECLSPRHVRNRECWMSWWRWEPRILMPWDRLSLARRIMAFWCFLRKKTCLGQHAARQGKWAQKSHGEWESAHMLSLHCSNFNWWPVCLQAAWPQRAISKTAWRFGGQSSASPSSLCLAAQSFLLLPCTELMVKNGTINSIN